MYSVSETYKSKIKENVRTFKIIVTIQHSNGTLTLYDDDIASNTLYVDEKSIVGGEFVAGGVVAKELGLTIIRKPEYDSINFDGAKILPEVGLLLADGYDEYTTFLNPNQPSYYPEMEDLFEFVPLGSFNIDEVNILSNTLEIKAVDNMIKLDEPYSLSSLSYPATLESIYLDICTFADVTPATLSFTNADYVVTTKFTENATYRDILAWVCELSGTFAYINKNNGLELRWYTPSGEVYDGNNRFSIKVKNYSVNVTGIKYETDDAIYLAGTDNYMWDLSGNPLLQDNYATVLNNLLTKVSALTYRPYTCEWQGDPAMEVGDVITHNTSDGNSYITLITHSRYKYRGKAIMDADGLPAETQGFKGSTDKRIELVRKQLEETIGNEVSDLEQAIIDATDLLTAELGGYVVKRQNELLIMDTTDVETAQKVWRWNLNGLGYSSTGVNGTYGTAITMNGAIVANYITTGTMSADRVRTGLITSEDGNTWINLDNGSFNFKNQLLWDSVDNRIEVGSGTLLVAPDISAGTITGSTIVGSLFKTANSGQRIEINSSGLKSYNVDNQLDGISIIPSSQFGTINFYTGFVAYSSTTTYYRGDTVSYGGAGYQCIVERTSSVTGVLPTNTTYWTQIVASGQPLTVLEADIGNIVDISGRTQFGIRSYDKDIFISGYNDVTGATADIVLETNDDIYLDAIDNIALMSDGGLISLYAYDDIRIDSEYGVIRLEPLSTTHTRIEFGETVSYDRGLGFGISVFENFSIVAGDAPSDNLDISISATDRMYLYAYDRMELVTDDNDIDLDAALDIILDTYAGDVIINGQVTRSDERLKTDFDEVDSVVLDAIKSVPIISYRYKQHIENGKNGMSIGTTTQSVRKAFGDYGLNIDDFQIVKHKIKPKKDRKNPKSKDKRPIETEEFDVLDYNAFILLKIASIEKTIKELEGKL